MFDSVDWVTFVSWHWALALPIAVTFFWITSVAVRSLHEEDRETIALRLMGVEEERWANSFCQMFDALFGENHFTWRCVRRSIIASFAAITLLWFLFGGYEALEVRTNDAMPFLQVLVLGIAINLVADYVSLLETR